jgi:hypothetical protein
MGLRRVELRLHEGRAGLKIQADLHVKTSGELEKGI